MCLVSSYVVDALGFRSGMFLGCGLTFLGGLTRCLSTLPGLAPHMELDTQFWLSVTGQALTGIPSKIVKLKEIFLIFFSTFFRNGKSTSSLCTN